MIEGTLKNDSRRARQIAVVIKRGKADVVIVLRAVDEGVEFRLLGRILKSVRWPR